MDQVRAFGLSGKAVTIIFICLHALILVLMISCLATPNWVEMKDVDNPFKGSLYGIEEGFEQYEGESYNMIAEDFEARIDENEDESDDDSEADYLKAMSTLFSALSLCCCLFFVYELCALMMVALTIVSLALNFVTTSILWVPFVTITFGETAHGIGSLLYMLSDSMTFSDDCNTLHEGKTPGDLCARDGPRLVVVTFVLYFITGIALCFAAGCMLQGYKQPTNMPPPAEAAYPGVPVSQAIAYSSQPLPQHDYQQQLYQPGPNPDIASPQLAYPQLGHIQRDDPPSYPNRQ